MSGEVVKKKILVVDDDRLTVTLVSKALEEMGFEVLVAGDGQEALAIIKGTMVDLIVLDMMMPKMDGIKTCGLIKADRRYRNIPVIMFTDSADDFGKKICEQVGANDFCNKPLGIPALKQKILDLI